MPPRVRVDSEKCVGHGRCYALAPEIFEEDDRGHCVIPREAIPPERIHRARLGADNCPEEAITVSDD